MDYNPFKRKISELNKIEPQRGRLLVAEPFMQDPYFKRSVVYLTEHNQDGTVGFILNQPLEMSINDVLKEFPFFDAPVYLGGPVQPQNLFYLHTKGDLLPESIAVGENIFWNGNFETLMALIEKGEIQSNEIRFFLGYSGWETGQLAGELEDNSWFIQHANEAMLFGTKSDELWKEVLKSADRDIAQMANFPEDPSLN